VSNDKILRNIYDKLIDEKNNLNLDEIRSLVDKDCENLKKEKLKEREEVIKKIDAELSEKSRVVAF